MIAGKGNTPRRQMEEFALESTRRAIAAIERGFFTREIAPINGLQQDETPRVGTTLEKMATLEALTAGGRITAAVSSQIADAAAAMLIASEGAVRRRRLKPRARIHHLSVWGADTIWMLSAPLPVTLYALSRSGPTLADIDLV